ncbi:hypothetical protein SKAU_G00122340 [Synaphobranchus kaupii]|uniref:Uncharacterized protein n=1 Tax=Synaphobranchus kaupii TaxID=118154 RepID=A0A9Q1FNZ0_SYNKA|nr:hypothetical protein SKAU_G00122340 [Synaphobranchus kaupii]
MNLSRFRKTGRRSDGGGRRGGNGMRPRASGPAVRNARARSGAAWRAIGGLSLPRCRRTHDQLATIGTRRPGGDSAPGIGSLAGTVGSGARYGRVGESVATLGLLMREEVCVSVCSGSLS